MKASKTKTTLILILAGTVTFSAGLWLYATMEPLGPFEYAAAAAVLLVVGMSIYIATKRIKDEKKGLPVEDEMSNSIRQKAAAHAFYFSIYLWTMIILFMGDTDLELHVPVGLGILGMAVLFMGFWFYYSKSGVQDENTH